MSIIDQAAKRLEELSRAGVTIPWGAPGTGDAPAAQRPANGAPVRLVDPYRAASSGDEPPRAARSVELNLERLEAAGYLVPRLAHSPLGDEFRHIKRALLRNVERAASGAGARNSLIMVTSALPGEGKTYCAINLAMSIAMEVDTSVLLVDTDVIRPAVLGRLDVSADRGLLDLLTRPEVSLHDVVLDTNVPKLSLLPTGTLHDRSTELLASAAMERLLQELGTRYADRVVIFDAPPLLATSAAATLAASVGQVVMVVESARTARRAVGEAFTMLEACPIVMSVLNKCDVPLAGRRYGYDYA